MSTPPGLREQKKLSTRAALTERALELADERGYDGFTIADLVDLVGVSRRTFSNYFAGKAECMAAISDSWMDGALDVIESASTDVPLTDLLREVLENVAEQIAATRTGFLTLAAVEPELASAIAARDVVHGERVAEVISARTCLPRGDLRVALLAEFCLAAGRACTQRWVTGGAVGGRAALARDLDLAFSLINFNALTQHRS
jgi:AcrR family transcriptional regulator